MVDNNKIGLAFILALGVVQLIIMLIGFIKYKLSNYRTLWYYLDNGAPEIIAFAWILFYIETTVFVFGMMVKVIYDMLC